MVAQLHAPAELSVYFAPAWKAGLARQFPVGGDQGEAEDRGERNIDGVVRGDLVAQLPPELNEGGVLMPVDVTLLEGF